jgi:hypothetical protein
MAGCSSARLAGNLITVKLKLLTKYYSSDQIDKNEMKGASNTYRGKVKVYTVFWWGNLMEGTTWKTME